jgi:hypothetical protein
MYIYIFQTYLLDYDIYKTLKSITPTVYCSIGVNILFSKGIQK